MKVNLGREVIQYTPEMYRTEGAFRTLEPLELEALMRQSGLTWKDVEYVYQFISRDLDFSATSVGTGQRRRKREAENYAAIYLQCADGHYDYKYVPGLDFLVTVRNLHQDMVKFFSSKN